MNYIAHRGGDQRFVLQSVDTGLLAGLLFPASPNESRRAFEYDFGSTNDPSEILNLSDFPELAGMPFFTIEYPNSWQYDLAFQSPNWQSVRSLFGAAAKAIGFHGSSRQPMPKLCSPVWQHTPPNLKGLWKIPAWAVECSADTIWTGNRDGLILAYTHEGEVVNQYQLPNNSRSIVYSSEGLYANCDDGQVYDLSRGKLPQPIFDARTPDIASYYNYQMQGLVCDAGAFFILDIYGSLTHLDAHWQMQWQMQKQGGQGWVLQVDPQAIYVGYCQGVTCFDRQTGRIVWQQPTPAAVLCGARLGDKLLIGTSDGTLYHLLKEGDIKAQQTGIQPLAHCDAAIYACTVLDDVVIVADHLARLSGYSSRGELLWQYSLDCGAVLNWKIWNDRLYAVTTNGTLACFDLNTLSSSSPPPATLEPAKSAVEPTQLVPETAIAATIQKQPRTRKPKQSASTAAEPVASKAPSDGVLVECYKQGSQLKVRVLSPGYHSDWNVQFPRELRQPGMRYSVTALQEAKQGGFYRVIGTIQPWREP